MTAILRYFDHPSDSLERRESTWLGLIILLAIVLRLFHLGAEPLWIDEAYSWRATFRPVASMWKELASGDANPPLFYTIAKLFTTFNDSEAMLRLPALLAGVAAIPVIWLLGRAIGGSRVGLLSAFLLALSYVHVEYSQEARVYSLLMTATLLAIYGLVAFLLSYDLQSRRPTGAGLAHRPGRALVAYSIGCVIALYGHNTSPLLPLIANIAALMWWTTRGQWSSRFACSWIAANVVTLIIWAWWIPYLFQQVGGGDAAAIAYLQQPSPLRAFTDVARLYGGAQLPFPGQWLKIIFPLPLLAIYALWRGRDQRAILSVLAAFAVGLPVIFYVIGLVFHPVWEDRYLLWSVGPGFVLIAFGIVFAPDKTWRTTLFALVLGANIYMLGNYFLYDHKTPWREIAVAVGAELESRDTVAIAPHTALPSWAYYAGHENVAAHELIGVIVPPYQEAEPSIEPADLGAINILQAAFVESLSGRDHFWLVFWYPRNGPWAKQIVEELERSNWNVTLFKQWHYNEVQVYRVSAKVDGSGK